MVEKNILCKIPAGEVVLGLLSAFYVLNMHYPQGCSNFYSFFEQTFMIKKPVGKKTRLASILARIETA